MDFGEYIDFVLDGRLHFFVYYQDGAASFAANLPYVMQIFAESLWTLLTVFLGDFNWAMCHAEAWPLPAPLTSCDMLPAHSLVGLIR